MNKVLHIGPQTTAEKTGAEMLVTLTVGQLREIVRQEIRSALETGGKQEDQLLSVDEAAELLNLSKQWLYRNHRKLPFAVSIGRSVKFSRGGLHKWVETRKR